MECSGSFSMGKLRTDRKTLKIGLFSRYIEELLPVVYIFYLRNQNKLFKKDLSDLYSN